MKNKISKLLAIASIAVMTLVGCQKDDLEVSPALSDIITSGLVERPLVLNGDTLFFKGKHNPSKKGYYISLENSSAKSVAYVNNVATYTTLKVPIPGTKRFFYIMVENLKANVANSYAYQNNVSNVPKYGRLYTWQAAYNYRNNVVMKLPQFSATTGLPISGSAVRPVGGRLPSFQNIKDLLQVPTIGHLPTNGTFLFDSEYYNHFVFGVDEKSDVTDAHHSLSGWRDNLVGAPSNREFNDLTIRGRFWTNEQSHPSGDAHYPLEILDDTHDWVAYINAGHINGYAFAVRYVFIPTFK